ncbi:MAG: homocysteine S-methyltransferase family protein [Sandaracinus sp.]|nr:homocysteine S-methyltransferase family protein [Sandaracinus sp.]MCB9634393.1 homocysteine S-methyltransferase family protein [Sandaracinus sp.]
MARPLTAASRASLRSLAETAFSRPHGFADTALRATNLHEPCFRVPSEAKTALRRLGLRALGHSSEVILLLDGPVGTELLRRGVSTPLPAWSADAIASAPDVLAAIHADYAASGAQVHTTNTFRTRPRTMGAAWEEAARRAAAIARSAVPEGHRIAGSIAPIEDCYRPDLSPGRAARREHRALARVLADAGVDLLLCETFPHVDEACVAVEEAVATGLPTWVSLTPGPEADLLTPGALAEGLARAVDAGAVAVLVNCVPASRARAYVEAIADRALGVPIGVYANAGHVDEAMGWAHVDEPEAGSRYLTHAREWVGAGATIVGGCCGTGPAHVRALLDL